MSQSSHKGKSKHAKSFHIQTPKFDQSTNLNVSKKNEIHASQDASKFYVLVSSRKRKPRGPPATCCTGSTCGKVNLLRQHVLNLSLIDESHISVSSLKIETGRDVKNEAMDRIDIITILCISEFHNQHSMHSRNQIMQSLVSIHRVRNR